MGREDQKAQTNRDLSENTKFIHTSQTLNAYLSSWGTWDYITPCKIHLVIQWGT